MNKLDLGILIGAAVMALVAGGIWFVDNRLITLTPMQPSADVPVFRKVDPEDYARERRRIAVVVPRPTDDPVTATFLKAAKGLRNSPCSASATTRYLDAMTAYARNNLQKNLAKAQRGEADDPELSPLEHQASEYFDVMLMHGFISQAEFRDAMKDVSPNLGLALAAGEQTGSLDDSFSDMAGDACERRKRGEPQPSMSWEPQPDERSGPRRK
jgi:hypothetical protein